MLAALLLHALRKAQRFKCMLFNGGIKHHRQRLDSMPLVHRRESLAHLDFAHVFCHGLRPAGA